VFSLLTCADYTLVSLSQKRCTKSISGSSWPR
jgi:hypothetical protein